MRLQRVRHDLATQQLQEKVKELDRFYRVIIFSLSCWMSGNTNKKGSERVLWLSVFLRWTCFVSEFRANSGSNGKCHFLGILADSVTDLRRLPWTPFENRWRPMYCGSLEIVCSWVNNAYREGDKKRCCASSRAHASLSHQTLLTKPRLRDKIIKIFCKIILWAVRFKA